MPTNELEAAFLSRYERPAAERMNYLTATPSAMEDAITPIIRATLRAQLPDLSEEQRKLMAGQLTPSHRELLLTLCGVLERRRDIAAEAGFGKEVFQEILDKDIAAENFGAAADRMVRALTQGEAMLSQTLSALSTRALLAAQELAAARMTPEARTERDQLLSAFQAALTRQAQLMEGRADKGSADASKGDARSVKALRSQLEEAQKSQAVAQAVDTILAAAPGKPGK
jgi:hypothetical protein